MRLFDQAISSHKQALELRNEISGNVHSLVDSCYSIGIVYFDMGLFNEALKYHCLAMEKKLTFHSDVSEEIVENHYWLGLIYKFIL